MEYSHERFPRMAPLESSTPPTRSRQSSFDISRKTSWGTTIPPPTTHLDPLTPSEENLLESVELDTDCDTSVASHADETWNTLDNIASLGLSFTAEDSELDDFNHGARFVIEAPTDSTGSRFIHEQQPPFNKWLNNLHKKGTQRRKTVSCDSPGVELDREPLQNSKGHIASGHKKSSSGSSFGFVTAVKSASVSIASFSVAARSKKTDTSTRQNRAERSSRASNTGRLSEDSSYTPDGVIVDHAVTARLLQRRRVLEELISTEEGYVADIRFLMNVYVTLLASIPTLSMNLRASINRNLNEIIELHDEILGDLHRVVPHSEYTQACTIQSPAIPKNHGHLRWRSLDAVMEGVGDSSWLQRVPGMTAEPKVAADVARVFGKKIHQFFVYEEYGAKYEMMIRDVASTHRTLPQWDTYQRGLEALGASLASINSQINSSKKALTVGDLLVKPIQRVCKYPLLFAELLKQTPVCDCPESHAEIENVLIRLREATAEINRATEDPRMKGVMEKSWLLQDRLVFPNQPAFVSMNTVRALGHVHLCGVLHASWQTKDGVDGQYLICLMYRDFLLLASSAKSEQVYVIQACIGINQIRLEEIDNGRGIQCHTAPFSWKLVFEFDHQLFELTMSACSPKEELEWRSRLSDGASKVTLDTSEQSVFTSLALAIKPLGTVFGKPGTVARRISIHRATTVGPTSGLCQVIIKNTNAFKDVPQSVCLNSINRSQSLLTTNRIPVLSPSRADRIRLENLVSDVWTRDILPFPGMSGRARSEHPVRASASSIMRKLSVASIASNFTKRSGSLASVHRATEEDTPAFDPMSNKSDPAFVEEGTRNITVYSDFDGRRVRSETWVEEKFHHPEKWSIDHHDDRVSPASTIKRLATLRINKGWAHDGQRIITPPLRTSSANSLTHSKPTTVPVVTDLVTGEKENVSRVRHGQHSGKKSKGLSRARGFGADGLWSFFR